VPGTPYQDDIHVRRQRGQRMAVALAYDHAVEVEVSGVASQSPEQAEAVKCHQPGEDSYPAHDLLPFAVRGADPSSWRSS